MTSLSIINDMLALLRQLIKHTLKGHLVEGSIVTVNKIDGICKTVDLQRERRLRITKSASIVTDLSVSV